MLLRLAREAAVPVEEGRLNRERLGELSELFVSGTTSEVMPVVRVDGRAGCKHQQQKEASAGGHPHSSPVPRISIGSESVQNASAARTTATTLNAIDARPDVAG